MATTVSNEVFISILVLPKFLIIASASGILLANGMFLPFCIGKKRFLHCLAEAFGEGGLFNIVGFRSMRGFFFGENFSKKEASQVRIFSSKKGG